VQKGRRRATIKNGSQQQMKDPVMMASVRAAFRSLAFALLRASDLADGGLGLLNFGNSNCRRERSMRLPRGDDETTGLSTVSMLGLPSRSLSVSPVLRLSSCSGTCISAEDLHKITIILRDTTFKQCPVDYETEK